MEDKPKIGEEQRQLLNCKFPDKAYSAHPTKTFLTTLKAAYVMERLNDVFGLGRWTLKHEVILDNGTYVLMKGQLIILDYDCEIPEQYGGHGITGKNTEIADGYKSAITDILSKSASYLEIGIQMFKGEISPPKGGKKPYNQKHPEDSRPWLNETTKDGKVTEQWTKACKYIAEGGKIERISKDYQINKDNIAKLQSI